MRIDIAAQTDIGKHKKNNEDCYGVFREDYKGLQLFREGALLAVADGLGGHIGGEIASKLAVSVFKDCLKEPAPPPAEDLQDFDNQYLEILRKAIARANDNVYQTNVDLVRSNKPMGTTLLGAVIDGKKVYIVNVGDSRCYHIREGELIATTEDHSWVDEQVKLGLMSRAEAESDSRRNLVTRSIGTHPEMPVDTYVWHMVQGDKLLLCTDGLINMVKDADIREVFRKRGSAAEYAQRLVDMALQNGGKDNVTVIVAHIHPTPWHFVLLHVSSFFRKHGKKVLWTLVTLAFGALCFVAGYYTRGLFPK